MYLAAYAAGKGTQAELALVFGVSVGWAEKVCRQHRQSGQPERIEQRHGPTSRVDAAAQACLLDAIKERPDLTIEGRASVPYPQASLRIYQGALSRHLEKPPVAMRSLRAGEPVPTP
jgi:transposase